MNKYELTVVLDSKLTPAKRKQVVSGIEKIIETFKGKIEKTEEWGEKELAVKIAKKESGYFIHFLLELQREAVKTLNLKLKMEDDVLRHLFVRIE